MLKSDSALATNYFDSASISLRPSISAEWNYNSIYQPYATYSSNGTNVMTLPAAVNLMLPQAWSKDNASISLEPSTTGKTTSVFTKVNSLKIVKEHVTAWDLYSDNVALDLNKANWVAQISTTKLNVPSGKKSYKIVFYAKAVENNLINLSVSATHPDPNANLSFSKFVQIDNVEWTKVEVLFGVRPDDNNSYYSDYDHINFKIDATNTTYSKANWSFIIDRFEVYEITYFDFQYGNLWSKEAVFNPFRPGESYVSTGNADYVLPTNFRKVIDGATIYNSDGTTVNLLNDTTKKINGTSLAAWNDQMPCSSITYSPRILFGNTKNPLFKNGMLSPFSSYKYFVSDKTSSYIGATYEENMKINKLVLKFNISQSKPDAITAYLYSSGALVSAITIPESSIDASGKCTLYYQQNGTWSTAKWASTAMPIFDIVDFGKFKFNGTSTNAYQEINQVVLYQSTATITNNLSGYPEGIKNELTRLHVIEVSPRLEVDISNYVISFDVAKELDNKSNLVPISAISANSASVVLTNIPIPQVGSSNSPLFLFSTNANASPLKNLLVKNVKFYINFKINTPGITGADSIIPGGVFYVNSWDTKDIDTTTVSLFDVTKYLQLLPVNDYVTAGQTLFNVITNILDSSGFTDYDYDQLANICRDKSQQLSINYFFADSKNKTVFDILRELFTAYQVGAFIDEYGVMRFLNLKNITKNNQTTFILNDSNISTKGYDEIVKTKIGKINFRYKLPQVTRTINSQENLVVQPKVVWKQDNLDVITFNYLNDSMSSLSQHFFDLSVKDFTSLLYGVSLDGENYCIIEGEIMSFTDKMFRFESSSAGKTKDVIVNSSADLQYAAVEFTADIGFSDLKYSPTGRIANVKRGLFNTPIKTHMLMKTAADVKKKFTCKTRSLGNTAFTESDPLSPNSLNFIQVRNLLNSITHMIPINSGSGYKTYSTKFRFNTDSNITLDLPKTSLTNFSSPIKAGLFLGMQYDELNNSTSSTMYIELQKESDSKYILNAYSIDTYGTKVLWHSIDVSEKINTALKNDVPNVYPANNFTNFINLQCVINTINTNVLVSPPPNVDVPMLNYFAKKPIDNITIYANKVKLCDLNTTSANAGIQSALMVIPKTGQFGFFTNGGVASSVVELSEIYAYENELMDKNVNYHFQSKDYLNNIVIGTNKTYKHFFVQSKPEVIGLNFYDVQFDPAPVLGAEPVKLSYQFVINPSTTNTEAIYQNVQENAVAYSDIATSGFKAKFAILNRSPYAVWTKSDSNSINTIDINFQVNSEFLLSVSPEKNIERIIDSTSQETVEIQSDWVQSAESARSVSNTIAQAVDNFSKDTIVTMFGNPLIQLGDVARVTYNLLNIPESAYFVQSVRHSFNQGLTTSLTLNKISYTGPANANPIVYIPPITVLNSSLSKPSDVIKTATSVVVPDVASSISAVENLKVSWAKAANATGYILEIKNVDPVTHVEIGDYRDISNVLVTNNFYEALDIFTVGNCLKISVSSYNNNSTGARATDSVIYYTVQPNPKDALATQAPINTFLPQLSESRSSEDFVPGNANTGVVSCDRGSWSYTDTSTTYSYTWYLWAGGTWAPQLSNNIDPHLYTFTNISSSFKVKCKVIATNSIDSTSAESYEYEVVPRTILANYHPPQVTEAAAYIAWDDAIVVHWTDTNVSGSTYKVRLHSYTDINFPHEIIVNSGIQTAIFETNNMPVNPQYAEIITVWNGQESKPLSSIQIQPKKTSINNFIASGNLNLSWDAVTDADYYIVKISKTTDPNYNHDSWIPAPSDIISKALTSEFTTNSYITNQFLTISISAHFSDGKTGPIFTTTYKVNAPLRQVGRGED